MTHRLDGNVAGVGRELGHFQNSETQANIGARGHHEGVGLGLEELDGPASAPPTTPKSGT